MAEPDTPGTAHPADDRTGDTPAGDAPPGDSEPEQPAPGDVRTGDAARRAAARAATLVAVPVALVVAALLFWFVNGRLGGSGGSGPTPAVTGNGSGTPAAQATAPVAMPAPSLPEEAAGVCRTLLNGLPQTIRDRARRPVTEGTRQNAAYGDPPITLACGAGPMPSLPPTAIVYGLAGVCWAADESDPDATVWTTLDRRVPVVVTVPRFYQQPGQWTAEFSAPVRASVPDRTDVPTGCR